MITVRTGAWTKEDKAFFAEVLATGLNKNCYVYNTEDCSQACTGCRHIISCKDMQSAYHHILSIMLRDDAKILNEQNKTL